MKNIVKLFGIIVLVAMVGFSFASCNGPGGLGGGGTDPALNGLWGGFWDGRFWPIISFNNGNFQSFDDDDNATLATTGTFTTSGGTLTLLHTHVDAIWFCCFRRAGGRWGMIPADEVRDVLQRHGNWYCIQYANMLFRPQVISYTVSGNNLQMSANRGFGFLNPEACVGYYSFYEWRPLTLVRR